MNCDRFIKLKRFFPVLNPLFFYIFGRFVQTKCHTFLKIALKCRLDAKWKHLPKGTMHKLQMPKWTRNNCKNSKQTNWLVLCARSFVQKSQITEDTSKLCKQQVWFTHQSSISYLYLVKYVSHSKVCVSDKITRLFKQKIFPYKKYYWYENKN